MFQILLNITVHCVLEISRIWNLRRCMAAISECDNEIIAKIQ